MPVHIIEKLEQFSKNHSLAVRYFYLITGSAFSNFPVKPMGKPHYFPVHI